MLEIVQKQYVQILQINVFQKPLYLSQVKDLSQVKAARNIAKVQFIVKTSV